VLFVSPFFSQTLGIFLVFPQSGSGGLKNYFMKMLRVTFWFSLIAGLILLGIAIFLHATV
jgi:hypothetical protein